MHQEQAIVEVKRAMMANAVKRILCVDSTKFGKSALHRVAPLTDFDLIITDSGITDSEVEALTASGVPHRIVELNTKNPHRSFANTE